MSKKILHFAFLDKFIPGFIEIIDQHFSNDKHTIFTIGNKAKYPYETLSRTIHFSTLKNILCICKLITQLHKNDKVILHGLFSPHIIIMLCFMPWLHKKLYWIIWGGDLYCHELAVKNLIFRIVDPFRKILISRLKGLITYVDGDYEKAQQWYGATGKLYECIMYKSNIYKGSALTENDFKHSDKEGVSKVNIQVGNSADPTNNHEQIFNKLSKFDVINKVDKIYCPLSYGNLVYAQHIKKLGIKMFGDKFYPLMSFMPLHEYEAILDVIDIAIFAHERQQAMGNTINLLGRGKKVYMRDDTSSYALFNKLDIIVHRLDDLELRKQDLDVSIKNNHKIINYFNETHLVYQLSKIFS
ncbi:TDP-N-acetylfucosamine:lipid II N-acetylfucosaminyltransferase [Vibrio metschnikovii]|nr:TDP-N-acetylfucosamine:lipid II N-acetylfucosaminyltransferase [Vibrio metschnikovii]